MTTTKKLLSSIDALPSVQSYLRRINAEVRSLRTAVVKEIRGRYWKDIAVITFNRDGTVIAPAEYVPSEDEAEAIKAEFATVDFPKIQPISALTGNLPEQLANATEQDRFIFRDLEHRIVFVQVRRTNKTSGEKIYLPFTFWDDNTWRMCEPEGQLPLYGLETIGSNTTVFVHEGAKAARFVRELVEARTPTEVETLKQHPWGHELQGAAHLGWIGGALSPDRTNWRMLKEIGVKRVYIVSDNDFPGLSAVPSIAFHVNVPTFHIQFTSEWPVSFDLADPFPEAMFAKIGDVQRYIGPSFRAMMHPATWATDIIPPKNENEGGKPAIVLRDSFKDQWAYVEEADLFINKEMPGILRTEGVVNKLLAPFSHTSRISNLIVKEFRGRTTRLCYRPDIDGRVVTDNLTSAINLHLPSDIRGSPGDAGPFLEFMAYLFPDKVELAAVLKWCATLIARPQTRMNYGLLLTTAAQGIGKTTLAASILAPLVGTHNTGFPSESDITSEFNGWLINKRLVVVNEIYMGHSWKAYMRLKGIITDSDITVNQKYQRTYTIENWAHVIACSNSRDAIKIEEDDRRWFYPRITEKAWTRGQFTELRQWLAAGGLSIIRDWAERYGDYVLPGECPPGTKRKSELIESSRSEGTSEAAILGEALARLPEPVAMGMREVTDYVRSSVQGRLYESAGELQKAMEDVGCVVYGERVILGGKKQSVIVNPAAMLEFAKPRNGLDESGMINKWLRSAKDVLEVSM